MNCDKKTICTDGADLKTLLEIEVATSVPDPEVMYNLRILFIEFLQTKATDAYIELIHYVRVGYSSVEISQLMRIKPEALKARRKRLKRKWRRFVGLEPDN